VLTLPAAAAGALAQEGPLVVLHVHRSERADALAGALAEVLREPPADPFAPDVIAVPAKGVERWLTQRLSHILGSGGGRGAGLNGGVGVSSGVGSSGRTGAEDGVCANVRFPSPTALVEDALAAASGVPRELDAWEPARILWPLLEVIDACAGEQWCSALAGHLGLTPDAPQHRRGRRFTAAQHLASLFTAYGSYRPAMLREWAVGADTDGAGAALAADVAWQAELWRRLRQTLAAPSPAERLDAGCAAIRANPEIVDLPERLSLFGPTRLTTDQRAVLAALSQRREVHLWLAHPSPVLWERVAALPPAPCAQQPRRRTDPTRSLADHPLLASLGRDVRELQLVLAGSSTGSTGSTGSTASTASTAERVEHHHPLAEPAATVLGRLQAGISADNRPPGAPLGDEPDTRQLLEPGDTSIQVHACHGPARQVEVLREVLLGLLAADPSLEPRDVLVMCPDVETYAPLVSATFGLDDAEAPDQHPGHRLRVRLADRSLRRTNPMLDLLAQLLELADARVTASEVLDLAGSPPVRRRFGWGDDELERLRDWAASSGVRWGLDAAHRAPFGLQRVGQNTWQAGLDRILLGASMAEDELRWVGLALPLDDVDSGDIDLAGRLAELVDRLGETLAALTGEQPLEAWLAALAGALPILGDVAERDGWQLAQARAVLAEVAAAAGERAGLVRLTLADVRALLAGRLQGRPTRAGFRTGTLTVCSMVPMRSVPHRVICLLGLDDGAFPRGSGTDGDDVLARDPCVGERDRRSEDRQLLLDAVMAAQDHFVVLYSGADERTNAPRPPAVPVGELLTVLEASTRTADGGPVRDAVVVRHPLQPFDARNFTPGTLGTAGPFSFDTSALAGARRAATGPRLGAPPFLAAPLAPLAEPAVELAELVSFLEHPVRGFLRQRLGVVVLEEEDEVADALSVELGPLDTWQIGDRMLGARLNGADQASCRAAEWRRGMLPPGPLGRRLLEDLERGLEPLVAAGTRARDGSPEALDVRVELPGRPLPGQPAAARLLSGTVGELYGASLVRVVFSRLGPKHRLRAWVHVLALAAAWPEQQWQAITIGRGKGKRTKTSVLTAPAPEEAARRLADLVDLRDRGLCEPLPIAAGASHGYATRREQGEGEGEALQAARSDWGGRFGDATDRYNALVWGEAADFDVLLAAATQPDDGTPSGLSKESLRFGRLARRLWSPLLAAEQIELG